MYVYVLVCLCLCSCVCVCVGMFVSCFPQDQVDPHEFWFVQNVSVLFFICPISFFLSFYVCLFANLVLENVKGIL